jgi:hypothetical protein
MPWPNHRRRGLVCPSAKRFTRAGFAAVIEPCWSEIVALLEDRRPGGQRASRPIRTPGLWDVFHDRWRYELVPTLAALALRLAADDQSISVVDDSIQAYNHMVDLFWEIDHAA